MIRNWKWTFSIQPSGMFQRLFGKRKLLTNIGLWDQLELPDQEAMDRHSQSAMLAGQSGYTQEFRVRKAGKTFWIRETVTIAKLGPNRFWLVGVATDISEQKRIETELGESEERFRTLSNAGFESIVISENGLITDVNDQALALMGAERAELIGHAILDFVAPESREAVVEAVRADSEQVYEHQILRKNGKIFPAEVRSRTLPIGSRRVRMTALRDITARKQLESDLRIAREEAVAASQLKANF